MKHIVVATTPDNSPIEYYLTNMTYSFTIYQDNINSYAFEVKDVLPEHAGTYNFIGKAQKPGMSFSCDDTIDVQIKVNRVPRLVYTNTDNHKRNNHDNRDILLPATLFVDDDGDEILRDSNFAPIGHLLGFNNTSNLIYFRK